MDKVISEVQGLITRISGMPGQEPSIRILHERLGELYAAQATSDDNHRASIN